MPRIKDMFLVLCVEIMIFMSASATDVAQESKYMQTYREHMNDDGKPFVEYQCTSEMDKYNLLSWYQIQGSKHMLLNLTQHQDNGKENKTVTLHHTLEDTDNQTDVYCIKEGRAKDVTIKQVVQWVQLTFNRTFPSRGSGRVSITPSSKTVYLYTDTTMTFVCKGPTSIDGRKLTWYFESYTDYSGEQSDEIFIKPEFEIAESQTYDVKKKENVLKLKLNKTFHLKRLFCAQDLHAQVKTDNGEKNIVRFGQRGRSETVTFIFRNSSSTGDKPNRQERQLFDGSDHVKSQGNASLIHGAPFWSIGLLAVLASILFIALIIVIIKWKKTEKECQEKERLWNRPGLQTPNDNQYETVYSHGAGLLRRPKIEVLVPCEPVYE